MNNYLFHPDMFKKYYNCSYYDVNMHPVEQRRDVLYGLILIAGSLFFQVLYLPIIPVLFQSHFQKESCYKLMSIIAVVDVVAISVNGLLTGYFAIIGAVYCMFPFRMLVSGIAATFVWMAESDLAILLALNRCLNMICPKLCRWIFDGKRTYFWVAVAITHAFLTSSLTNTLTFNAFYGVWLLNPHGGYPDTGYDYPNVLHRIHNVGVSFSLMFLYIVFVICICLKKYGTRTGSFSFSEKPIFVQVFIMSFLNFACALIYTYEQHFPVPKLIMQFSQFGWMCIHGLPSVIYLVLNKSIRRQVFKIVGFKERLSISLGKVSKISVTSPIVATIDTKHFTPSDQDTKYVLQSLT